MHLFSHINCLFCISLFVLSCGLALTLLYPPSHMLSLICVLLRTLSSLQFAIWLCSCRLLLYCTHLCSHSRTLSPPSICNLIVLSQTLALSPQFANKASILGPDTVTSKHCAHTHKHTHMRAHTLAHTPVFYAVFIVWFCGCCPEFSDHFCPGLVFWMFLSSAPVWHWYQ